MEVESYEVAKLAALPTNVRRHDDQQVALIVDSIRTYGFTNPVLIDESDTIIAGHGRVMAAQSMGLSEVPCIRLKGLSDEQKRAYAIADNKLALDSTWDEEALLAELSALGVDELTGFSGMELQALMDANAFKDEVPKGERKPASKTDDDHSSFEVVMLHENKITLLNVLGKIKADKGIETNELALMELVEAYGEVS